MVDDKTYFEIMPDWAKNITVGFARMEGHPVGIVANNPMFLAGCLDIDTSTKASRSMQNESYISRMSLVLLFAARLPLRPCCECPVR